ncbi:MAG: APC family permease [Novosphingobium sp.]|uniref:APC family permease n=1 Tax=Novosphingobium sp. TaxID=1874826 RepID=UPI00301ABE24
MTSQAPASSSQGNKSFDRVLSPGEVFLLTLSALSPVISVFIGGNAILHMAGTGAAIGFICGGLIAATMALLFAELSASYPGAGGVYGALNAILGPRWTYPYVILRTVLLFPLLAFGAVGVGPYIRLFLPSLSQEVSALGTLALAALIAAAQIRRGAQVIAAFLLIELVALLVLMIAALAHFKAANIGLVLSPVITLDGTSLVPASSVSTALAVIAGASMTAGADWATYFAEDMRDAKRRMGPVVAWTGLIAATFIAVPVVLMILGMDDVAATLSAEAPIAHFLDRTTSPLISSLVSLGIIVAIFNGVTAMMMALSRQLHAMGRDRVFPEAINTVLRTVSHRTRAPTGALLVLIVIGGLVTFLGERRLVLLSSGNFSECLLLGLALLAGRKAGALSAHFRIRLHPLVPIIALLLSVSIVAANWADADTARISMCLLVAVFSAAFAWHEWGIRAGRGTVRLSGSDLE